MRTRRSYWIATSIVAVIAFLACDDESRYEVFDVCTQDSTLSTDCDGGTSYTCPGESLPSDSDPTLVCENAYPDKNGETIFCCASQSSARSTCSVESTVTCSSDQIGYYCSGADTPEQSDNSLECTSTTNPTGGIDYCCTRESGAGCSPELDGGACAGGGTPYDCPANVSPTDPSLSCGSPTLLSNGNASYCCTSH